MGKRDWNVPCLLLRWSRCLLCWCSFLRWQEDLGGEENLGESIDFGNFWFLIPEQQLLMLLSFAVYLQSTEGISFAEGLCLPAQCRWWVPNTRDWRQHASRTVICPSVHPWQYDLQQAACVLVSTQTLTMRAVWGLRSHWCFWLNCLFPQTWIQSSTVRHRVLLDPLLPSHHRHTSTGCAGANWCSNPRLGGDPPGDHQSSHQERARTRGARAGRAEATHAAELHHELPWLNSWMCYQPLISFSLMEHVTCLVSTGLTVTANHMSELTIKYTMLHLLCYF